MSLQIRIHFSCNSNKRLKDLTWKHCFLCFIFTLRTLQKFCEVASIDDQLSKRNKCLNSDYLCDEKIKKRFCRSTSIEIHKGLRIQKFRMSNLTISWWWWFGSSSASFCSVPWWRDSSIWSVDAKFVSTRRSFQCMIRPDSAFWC